MEQQSWLAMRGFVDLVLGYWLLSRLWFQTDLNGVGQRARWIQIIIATSLLLLLQGLGIWSWAEIRAAAQLLPVIWPMLLLLAYCGYRIRRLQHNVATLEFEIDWRRDYQNFIHENYPALPPPRPLSPPLDADNKILTDLAADNLKVVGTVNVVGEVGEVSEVGEVGVVSEVGVINAVSAVDKINKIDKVNKVDKIVSADADLANKVDCQ